MKISVITVCKNSSKTIQNTIESVNAQSFKDIEHIFCDGGSNDGTQEIIKSLDSKSNTLLNGTDKGIYDAINKGIKHAKGEIIAILNSDDFYCSESALEDIHEAFESGVDAVYGDLVYVDQNNTNKVVRYWKSGYYNPNKFLWGWTVPHPALFIRKSVYDKYGLYNNDYKIAGDYDLILRVLYKHKVSIKYIPKVLVKMRAGGASNGSLSKNLKVHQEDKLVWKNNQLKRNPLTLILKPLRKMGQFIFPKMH